jgi:hypothetical protein
MGLLLLAASRVALVGLEVDSVANGFIKGFYIAEPIMCPLLSTESNYIIVEL